MAFLGRIPSAWGERAMRPSRDLLQRPALRTARAPRENQAARAGSQLRRCLRRCGGPRADMAKMLHIMSAPRAHLSRGAACFRHWWQPLDFVNLRGTSNPCCPRAAEVQQLSRQRKSSKLAFPGPSHEKPQARQARPRTSKHTQTPREQRGVNINNAYTWAGSNCQPSAC